MSRITRPPVAAEIDYPTRDGRPMAETDVHRDLMVDTIKRLQARYAADPNVYVSGNLARREALREELDRVDADTYLVEIKAAAIDVVAEAAVARGRDLVFADNELIGERVDEALLALAPKRVPA